MTDNVNHPAHYEAHKIVIEPIDVIATMPFTVGNIFKYVIRAKDKGNELEDLKKARWYLNKTLTTTGPDLPRKHRERLWVFAFSDNSYLKHFAFNMANRRSLSDADTPWKILDAELRSRIAELEEQEAAADDRAKELDGKWDKYVGKE